LSQTGEFEYVGRPRWRRWLLRLLALLALAAVSYGVYAIVREGTQDVGAERSTLQPALKRLGASQARLGRRLDELRPGRPPGKVPAALRATQRDQEAAVRALRALRAKGEAVPDEIRLADALGAEFDYLDALRSALTNARSPLLKAVGDRAQTAKDAFTELPDSAGVEDGIVGTQAFIAWARARG